ncbi:MAG TPA: BrnA antitoxin family protein [Terriglobia bacterium]|nr:BrnA antitoxin family protein [Terriglobia bacterium]
MKKLTKEQKRDIRAIAAKRDEDIDFSDAPPVLDWSGAEVGKFYRPKKQPVTIRLDAGVLAWLKAEGRGYQTKANWLLRHAMLHRTAEEEPEQWNSSPASRSAASLSREAVPAPDSPPWP